MSGKKLRLDGRPIVLHLTNAHFFDQPRLLTCRISNEPDPATMAVPTVHQDAHRSASPESDMVSSPMQ